MVSTFTPPPAAVDARTPPGGRTVAVRPMDPAVHEAALLVLPPMWTRPPRPPLPVLASVVPLLGAVVLWLVTGSILSLWLALLGPLIGAATMLDGVRGARRARTHAGRAADDARAAVAVAIVERHGAERLRRWARHPDVAHFVAHDDEVWRAVPGRADALVVGAGAAASELRVDGGEDDPASREIRARAAILTEAPVLLPVGAGIAVLGPAVLADAVVRGLALQLCLSAPPGEVELTLGRGGAGHAWAEQLPHSRMPGRTVLAVLGPDDAVPADADAVLVSAGEAGPTPPRCAAVLTVHSPQLARLDYAGRVQEVAVEAVAPAQAASIAGSLAERAGTVLGQREETSTVLLASLLPQESSGPREGLSAVIGVDVGHLFAVDLVADGPHAVVAGVTGSGKSELLITWILSLCATYTTREVSFLLADFKGGTAFDALADVPHVTGVITDLDGAGARRAIESLRAEVRWREAELARVGARDVRDARAELPRLVIVVDEFAALLDGHPELHAVFTDVAARGRALGMHLILGTQRVAGVVRDALLANCPLRVSLRVTDPIDSRAVVGTDHAAQLPGGAPGRGIAFVRRSGDRSPTRIRVALTVPADIAAVRDRDGGVRPRRPWLPELPALVRLDDVRGPDAGGELVLGLVDEPELQRQRPAVLGVTDRGLLIVGGAGTGRTTILRAIAAQVPAEAVWVDSTPERAWDALAALTERPAPRGTVLLIDDLDALATRFPHEYAMVVTERVERLLRGAGDAGMFVAVAMQRPTGAAARFAELLPHRAVLAMPSRAEYIAAGGESAHHTPDAPAGRGRLDGRAVQFCVATDLDPGRSGAAALDAWFPSSGITGFVGRRSAATREVLAAWQSRGARVIPVEDAVRDIQAPTPGEALVIAGDPDQWQRHWSLLAQVRGDHDLVIDAACQAEYRLIAGERDLPPYCAPGGARAWLRKADGHPQRIALPGADLQLALDRV